MSDVDRVVDLPATGWPRRAPIRYYIPDWDDLVDPDYDFATDTHSGGRGEWGNQVYAHQLLPVPAYDGLLVSRVVADKGRAKQRRLAELGSIHRYLRVPAEVPVMGDCGAFGYLKDPEPPYSTDDILKYYTRLGFDAGVSVDHLILGEEDRDHRYELTLHNAEVFLREHEARGLPWTAIGAVQGWDPDSYAAAARRVADMGYPWLALGGLVRTRTPAVLRTLEAVHAALPRPVPIHLFGLARVEAMPAFARLGVRSVDSASPLRQAWMRTRTSYLLDDTAYAALRIPQTPDHWVAKRLRAHPGLTAEHLRGLEAEALRSVRAWAARTGSLDDALAALMAYDPYATTARIDLTELYRRTLAERPWERCGCAVCEAAGVEVVIFRGNNRNRRRGFHNTQVFRRQLDRLDWEA